MTSSIPRLQRRSSTSSARIGRPAGCLPTAVSAPSTLPMWSIPTASIPYSGSTSPTLRRLRKRRLPCWHRSTRAAARRKAVRRRSSPTRRRTSSRLSSTSSSTSTLWASRTAGSSGASSYTRERSWKSSSGIGTTSTPLTRTGTWCWISWTKKAMTSPQTRIGCSWT